MLRKLITLLLVGAVLLSIAALGSAGLASLMGALGDQAAAQAARWAAWILAALWMLDLVTLLLAVATAFVAPPEPSRGTKRHSSELTSADSPSHSNDD